MYNALPDASLHECRVEMVPLDAIYVEGDQHDDDLVTALAHSIGLIGLQNPICVVENDLPDHAAPYRLISGKKRLAAFVKLKRPTIPAHILSYAETDSEQEVCKALATTEENFVRKHYSLIELCELVGESKALYERIHPTTQKGKAKKPKHSGTELFPAPVPKPLAYLDVAAQQLQKSRVTVWKYITIYNNLMKGHHNEFRQLKQCDHPILSRVEDLLVLSQSDDLEVLTRLLCGLGLTPEERKSKPRTLQEAQKRFEEYREKAARGSEARETDGNTTGSQDRDTTASTGDTTVDPPSAQDSGTDRPEMSTPQPPDTTTTPLAEEGLVTTPKPEAPACSDPASDEVLDTVEDVLIALERHITRYVDVHAPHRFTRFTIATHKTAANELHIIVEERA
jgi:hypothetical protein